MADDKVPEHETLYYRVDSVGERIRVAKQSDQILFVQTIIRSSMRMPETSVNRARHSLPLDLLATAPDPTHCAIVKFKVRDVVLPCFGGSPGKDGSIAEDPAHRHDIDVVHDPVHDTTGERPIFNFSHAVIRMRKAGLSLERPNQVKPGPKTQFRNRVASASTLVWIAA